MLLELACDKDAPLRQSRHPKCDPNTRRDINEDKQVLKEIKKVHLIARCNSIACVVWHRRMKTNRNNKQHCSYTHLHRIVCYLTRIMGPSWDTESLIPHTEACAVLSRAELCVHRIKNRKLNTRPPSGSVTLQHYAAVYLKRWREELDSTPNSVVRLNEGIFKVSV